MSIMRLGCLLLSALLVGTGAGVAIGWFARPFDSYDQPSALAIAREAAKRNVTCPTPLAANLLFSAKVRIVQPWHNTFDDTGDARVEAAYPSSLVYDGIHYDLTPEADLFPVGDHLVRANMKTGKDVYATSNINSALKIIQYWTVGSSGRMRIDMYGYNTVESGPSCLFVQPYTSVAALKPLQSMSIFAIPDFSAWPNITMGLYTYASNETKDDFMLFPVGNAVVIN